MDRLRKWARYPLRLRKNGVPMPSERGFLAPRIGETIAKVRARFSKWFALLEQFNRASMALLPKLEAPVDDNQKLAEATHFGRALQSLQASIIMAERGMIADARGSLRRAAEAAIFQLKMAKDAAFVDALVENHEHHRRKIANAALTDPGFRKSLTAAQVASLQNAIASIDAQYPQGPKSISIASVAASADGLALYNTIFRLTSDDAEHTSISSLGRHFKENKDGTFRLHFGPDLDGMEDTLGSIANVFLYVMFSAISSFKVAEHEPELAKLHEEYKKLLGGNGGSHRPGDATIRD